MLFSLMKLFPFLLLLPVFFYNYAFSESGVGVGYQLMVAVPVEYEMDFKGRAFLVETNQTAPNFRVALSIEAINGKYSCSLEVFLGNVKVWDSGHYSRFYITEKCLLELTMDGDLRLKGPKDRVGWKTGTSGQGVKRLQILRSGNLVLVDAGNNIKWQSFNFPTDVMLWGQQLDIATRLTSAQSNSSLFYYSFEIEDKKVAMYLNYGKLRYSYWGFQPSMNRSITYVKLSSRGLVLFDVKYKKIAQIPSKGVQPLRFLALNNDTGNFGLYYYSPEKGKFEASFQALNSTCDLPISCRPYGVCTFSNSCYCIQLLTNENKGGADCSGQISGGFCNGKEAEMLELDNISSVLKNVTKMVNISKKECADLCLQDCKCAAALYFRNASTDTAECYLYRLVLGLKQVDKGTGFNYMVKVPKGTGKNHERHNVKRWVLVVAGGVDGFIILLLVGGFGYWLVRRRTHTLHSQTSTT
ncbi:EP1-like glycoprotein 4 [Vigna radiata var. radiata]|uniref:EP1-like glycoprotein 4 n=1 Tax=Vigna radiata var. radiata TaxID=3916 RepID=A0A1S3TUL8_VIGRR|nr:EP1-like glycoprotein 4 [Vigna radiata var. radiata]